MTEPDAATRWGVYAGDVDVLLATKFHVPRLRADVLARPRLSGQLDGAAACMLVLVSTPAGFGKTTLLAGWAAGLVAGMVMLYDTPNPLTGKQHFGGAQYALSKFGFDTKVTIYTGILALALNLVVAAVATLALRAARAPAGDDITRAGDYRVEAGDPGVGPVPVSAGQEATA